MIEQLSLTDVAIQYILPHVLFATNIHTLLIHDTGAKGTQNGNRK